MGLFQKLLGQQKEQDAKHWLQQQGVQILFENYHCKGGEIDLIGLHQQTLVFIEVKARKTDQHGHPLESITLSKQQKLYLCAERFLQQHAKYQDYEMRFDAISFIADESPSWIQDILN